MADVYGTDIDTFSGPGGTVDINPLLPLISGPRVVLVRVGRRLITPRGSMPEAPLYGYALADQVGRRTRTIDRERMKVEIEEEAEKEPFVKAAKVTEFLKTGFGKYRLSLRITLAEGPFRMVLDLDGVTTALLETDTE